MNISKTITFLIAGIVVGAVLFFAGFGVLNLFNQDPEPPVITDVQVPTKEPVDAPKIQVDVSQTTKQSAQTVGDAIQTQGTNGSPIKIKPLANEEGTKADTNEQAATVTFGTLTLSTVNSVNGGATRADFLIENADGDAIALVKDTATSTLSLPVGDYKITVSQGSQKVVRFLGVKENLNGIETFELDVPVLAGEAANNEATPEVIDGSSVNTENSTVAGTDSSQDMPTESPAVAAGSTVEDSTATPTEVQTEGVTTSQANAASGVLRLSALTEQGKRPIVASFYIQQLNGQNVDTIRNVKTQQLTLPVGKYRITAKTDQTSVVKQVEVHAEKGSHEIFLIGKDNNTQQAAASSEQAGSQQNGDTNDSKKTGRLELFAQNAASNSPLKSNFYVQTPNGTMVASKVYVDSIGYKLPEGKYKVIVRAKGYKNKSIMLNVRNGQTRREVFKLNVTNSTNSAQNASNTTASSSTPSVSNTASVYGGLTVNVVSELDGSELAADIVITQPDGTPLKQARGASSASFDLPPREFLVKVTFNGHTSSHQVNVVAGKLAIKTISFNTRRLLRQQRRERRQNRERSQ